MGSDCGLARGGYWFRLVLLPEFDRVGRGMRCWGLRHRSCDHRGAARAEIERATPIQPFAIDGTHPVAVIAGVRHTCLESLVSTLINRPLMNI